MINRVVTTDIADHSGEQISVAGWVHRIRELGAVSFVLLRDRGGLVQLVYDGKVNLSLESVIVATGSVQANEKAPGGYEIHVESTTTLAAVDAELPVPINQDLAGLGIDALLDNRMLTLRNPKIRGVFQVQATIVAAFGEFLRGREFTEIKSSKLIGTGTEGGTGLFAVDYFGERVYLAQSPQFYKQAMVASGMERVFEIGAAYRAEKHDTSRHLNEYVSLDIEMGFIDDHNDLMDIEIDLLAHIFEMVAAKHGDVLSLHDASVVTREELSSVPRIDHETARKTISDRIGRRVFEINPEGERELCLWAEENCGVPALFVTGYPRKKRPFYTYPDGTSTRSFDLLFRGLEITTGGQRIHDYRMLLQTLPKFGLTEEPLSDYLSIFKYGCPPHGGFAIGLERLTQQILGLSNVKEASLFPRDRKRTRP